MREANLVGGFLARSPIDTSEQVASLAVELSREWGTGREGGQR